MSTPIINSHFSSNPKGYANEYNKNSSAGHSFRIRRTRLLEMMGKGNGTVLDVGAGPGVMAKEISDLGWKYHGTDFSKEMIEEAKRAYSNIASATFSVASAEHLPAQNNSVDIIVSMGLVEYVTSDKEVLVEMCRALVPQGRMYISIPNKACPMRIWDRYLIRPLSNILKQKKTKDVVEHREYNLSAYRSLMKECGITPLRSVGYNFRIIPRPFDYWLGPLTAFTASLLEPLGFGPLKFLATAYIVEGIKK